MVRLHHFVAAQVFPSLLVFTAGLPLGVTFSFLISSPLVDLASFLFLTSFFGVKIALAYVVVGLVLAVIGGTIIDKLRFEKYVEDYVKEIEDVDVEVEALTA